MKERIKLLADQAKKSVPHGLAVDKWIEIYNEKFAELIVKECAQLNQKQSYELAGVIIDTEQGDGFDPVCLATVKRVHEYLASNQLTEHFGVSNGS